MISVSLAEVNEGLLDELCAERASESLTLEFKRELPARGLDQAKVEFLKDVCAMANAAGGDILYGIEERDGAAAAVMPITGEPFEVAQRRLRQVLDGMEPRLDAVQFHEVPIAAGGFAMVVRVPQSFIGPHRFNWRFVFRDTTRVADMSYDQLRAAFDRTASLTAAANAFREERLEVIAQGHTWRPMDPGPLCVVHAVPIASMSRRIAVDVAAEHARFASLMLPHWASGSRSLNLDGLIAFASSRGKNLTDYTMLFRNGSLEMVALGGATFHEKLIPSTSVAQFYRSAIQLSGATFARLGISGPAVVAAAFLNIAGYKLALSTQQGFLEGMSLADRNTLVFPEYWVDDLAAFPAVDEIAQPMLDVLWQSFGLLRCFEYNEQGEWVNRG